MKKITLMAVGLGLMVSACAVVPGRYLTPQ